MRKLVSLLAVTAAIMATMLAAFAGLGQAQVVKDVPCGANLASTVNNDSSTQATRFQIHACTYNVNTLLKPKAGDAIVGPTGTFVQRSPAMDPEPTATIDGTGLPQIIKPQGTVQLEWFRVTGAKFDGSAGSGSGIAGGSMSPQSLTYAVRADHNQGVGISNANGVFDSVELDNNGSTASAGFIAGGIKGISEYVIVRSYLHDNVGNNVWCDVNCSDTSVTFSGISGKFQAVDNLTVRAAKQGIRWESVPSTGGEALILRNRVHANNLSSSTGGIGVRDAANAEIHNNIFGAATVAGIPYPHNGSNVAVHVSDSGRSDRPDTQNIVVTNNTLNGEVVKCISGKNLTCSPNN